MSLMNDMHRAALSVEEAALLPALPKNRTGSAALRTAMRAAEAMEEMCLSNAVDARIAAEGAFPAQGAPTYRRAGSRAALHHVLRR